MRHIDFLQNIKNQQIKIKTFNIGERSSFEEWIEQIKQLGKQIKEDNLVEVKKWLTNVCKFIAGKIDSASEISAAQLGYFYVNFIFLGSTVNYCISEFVYCKSKILSPFDFSATLTIRRATLTLVRVCAIITYRRLLQLYNHIVVV